MVDAPRAPLAALLALAVFFIASPTGAHAGPREAELERLRGRIARLQETLNETTEKRDAARAEIHAQERRINELARSLRETEARLARDARALAELERRAEREREAQRGHVRALGKQLRAAYVLGRQPYLKMLLNQESPAAMARALVYYRYFNDARVAGIERTQAQLTRLQELAAEIHRRTQALEALRETQARERRALEASRRRRADLLAALEREVADQASEMAKLRADERRLERLVRELKTMLPQASLPFPGEDQHFASLKGRLPFPFPGRVAARFGDAKGIGDLRWRGVFLAGEEGQEVRAVARGRVAFADWLRGFGLLLIMDHGDGYMTLYGHNEALYRHAGDWVEAGQPVAAAGNTGDAPGIGVYFEVRYNGVPQDPLQWCATGRTSAARARR